jgi:hypothetical protein
MKTSVMMPSDWLREVISIRVSNACDKYLLTAFMQMICVSATTTSFNLAKTILSLIGVMRY